MMVIVPVSKVGTPVQTAAVHAPLTGATGPRRYQVAVMGAADDPVPKPVATTESVRVAPVFTAWREVVVTKVGVMSVVSVGSPARSLPLGIVPAGDQVSRQE